MEYVHHSVWKAVGIYKALMGSLYKVHINKDLIFGLVERWCCETNTFVFPWCEATVTLEDMMILGGFSVLHDPVLFPRQSPELVEIEENLEKARRGLIVSKDNYHTRWLKFFMNNDSNFEHEAFLSLWLSRFVFLDKIGPHDFPIAVNLARGTRIALAPVVLASIYKYLSLSEQTMIMASAKVPSRNRHLFELIISLWAPLFFVQVWAWERFVSVQLDQAQNHNMVIGMRIGRWHNVKQSGLINLRTTIDSSGETFHLRAYALAVEGGFIPKFYKEKEEWTKVDAQDLDLEEGSLVRCLRASDLVGLDCCQEPYRPNRVAMQFGYDQDFPKWIPRSPSNPELAWYNYSIPIDYDLRLYYPSRLFETDVTTRYLKWWRKEILFLSDAFKGLPHGRKSKRRSKCLRNSPVFAPKLKQEKVETDWDNSDVLPCLPTECQLKQVENYPAVTPGFHPAVPPGVHPVVPSSFHPAVPPSFHPTIPPKCVVEYDKENFSMEVCQTVAFDVVPPGLAEKHNAGQSVYTSTDEHDSNETSGVVPPKCNRENDKENLSVEVCQTMACDVVLPGSVEKHVVWKDDRNESNRNTARDLMTKCDDLITVIELQRSELKRQVASLKRW